MLVVLGGIGKKVKEGLGIGQGLLDMEESRECMFYFIIVKSDIIYKYIFSLYLY